MDTSSRLKEIVATGQVPGSTVPCQLDTICITGGDQGTTNKVKLTDGSGGPVVAYVAAPANTTQNIHYSHAGFCANGIFVASFSNTGNTNLIVGHL